MPESDWFMCRKTGTDDVSNHQRAPDIDAAVRAEGGDFNFVEADGGE